MINQTKALLQHIQKDVEVYMEKIHQIEGQFTKTEEESRQKIEIPISSVDKKLIEKNSDIDFRVDKLLKSLEDKK